MDTQTIPVLVLICIKTIEFASKLLILCRGCFFSEIWATRFKPHNTHFENWIAYLLLQINSLRGGGGEGGGVLMTILCTLLLWWSTQKDEIFSRDELTQKYTRGGHPFCVAGKKAASKNLLWPKKFDGQSLALQKHVRASLTLHILLSTVKPLQGAKGFLPYIPPKI